MNNSETYIVTAKTVDEAMAIAQREYGGVGKDISFDILEMPKKGFLGIGAKDAKIKVTVTEEEEINLGSIVAEMKSYRMQTDRDGSAARDGESDKKQEKPAQPRQEKPAQPRQEKPAQPRQEKPAQPKQEKPAQPKQEKPAQPKQEKPAQPKQEKPAQPKQEKPAQPKQEKPAQPKQEKPVQPKQDRPAQPKAEQQKAQPEKKEAPKAEKPAFEPAKTGEKPVKKEAQASGILDNMPEYKIEGSGKKTPVYKETGANVKTYAKSPMQTAAVADGSIGSGDAPVADVRWDSARDLKKAEEAAAAAMAAASRAAAPVSPDAPVEEKIARKAVIEEPAEEEVYVPSDGSIDVAALDAAIEAMVEELPAPESRKKAGITAAEMEYALAFVTTLLANMQIDAKAVPVECPEGEEYEIEGDANLYPAMEIVGEGTGILIGHHGETLDAIQYLLNLAAIRHSDNQNGDYVKISLDIENYRAKREETLRSLARRMAARALKYKRNVFLEPMNAYERRIIHSELQSVENVSTHSVGTDKNRKIIITYEGPDKVFDDRRRSDKSENGENRRRDHGRSRKPKNSAPADAPAEEAAEGAQTVEAAEKPQGENKSRNRNRNRNRNRRRQNGEGALADAAAEVSEQPLSAGAAAIISGEEKEAFDRQLSDPTVGGKRPQQEISLEDLPSFQQKSSEEK
ncbi:MAG: Jag N-terminal domain-containing protein [Clostridia bacterium]|nr:Jag N-terminal domain-containing protein [Clostridia bacterium]